MGNIASKRREARDQKLFAAIKPLGLDLDWATASSGYQNDPLGLLRSLVVEAPENIEHKGQAWLDHLSAVKRHNKYAAKLMRRYSNMPQHAWRSPWQQYLESHWVALSSDGASSEKSPDLSLTQQQLADRVQNLGLFAACLAHDAAEQQRAIDQNTKSQSADGGAALATTSMVVMWGGAAGGAAGGCGGGGGSCCC